MEHQYRRKPRTSKQKRPTRLSVPGPQIDLATVQKQHSKTPENRTPNISPIKAPQLPCNNIQHLFFTTQNIDLSYQHPGEEQSWRCCKIQPCPNHHISAQEEEYKQQLKQFKKGAVTKPNQENYDACWDANHTNTPKPLAPATPVIGTSRIPATDTTEESEDGENSEETEEPTQPSKGSPKKSRLPSSEQPKREETEEPKQEEDTREGPPDPDNDPLDQDLAQYDSDDDNMSKVCKAFDGISKLDPNGTNWPIWYWHVQQAAGSLGRDYKNLLSKEADLLKMEKNKEVLSTIALLILDSIYHRYMHIETTYQLISALKHNFNIHHAALHHQMF